MRRTGGVRGEEEEDEEEVVVAVVGGEARGSRDSPGDKGIGC